MKTRGLILGSCLAIALGLVGLIVLLGTGGLVPAQGTSGIHKIRHVIIIMQENRSFDSYFGTFPGADGLPRDAHGHFTACLPIGKAPRPCLRPYHDRNDDNGGGAHIRTALIADVDGGKMDGFVRIIAGESKECPDMVPNENKCDAKSPIDVMGYHDGGDIPNYWAYAKNFVLQDHMFEPVASYSYPSHYYLVSAWSALCPRTASPAPLRPGSDPHEDPAFRVDPMTCKNDPSIDPFAPRFMHLHTTAQVAKYNAEWATASSAQKAKMDFEEYFNAAAWTDLPFLLDKNHVSWRYYVSDDTLVNCTTHEQLVTCMADDDNNEDAKSLSSWHKTPWIWNTLLLSSDVREDRSFANIQKLHNFFAAAKAGTLPAVTWITPSELTSEHPPATISVGQSYVTSIINAAMNGPDWDSTAIFVAWDDWGGFYDHVVPPVADANGYGIRVPGILISPYAKHGYIDHQTLSFDAYLRFIEDDFLNGQRLDPKTDGRPDSRISVREDNPLLGDLTQEFDFTQAARKPLLLSTNPKTTLVEGSASKIEHERYTRE